MKEIIKYFSDIFFGVKSLAIGMSITIRHYFRKEVTQEYPDNRETLKMFDRFRGELLMPHNENNQHHCTACGICEMSCPNGSIEVISKKVTDAEGKTKKALDIYVYHLEMCTMCELCVRACPSDAIKMGQGFEHAVFNRSELTKRLNNEGSELEPKNIEKN